MPLPERQRLFATWASSALQKRAIPLLVACISLVYPAPTSAEPSPSSPLLAATATAARTTAAPALHYQVIGAVDLSGTPMVMIHGFGQNAYAWRHLARPLARDRQIVLLDLKGFGHSPKPIDDQYSLFDQARLVMEVIEHLQLASVVLVGNSYGGGVALLLSLRLLTADDIDLRGLILIDSIAYQQDYPYFIDLLRTPVISDLVTSLVTPEFQVSQVLELAYHDDNKITDDQIKAYAEQIRTPEGRHALTETARRIAPPDLERITQTYREISVPALILWGKEDQIVPIEVAHRLHQDLPDSELVLLPRAGHLPHEEEPQRTLDHIEQFLYKNSL
jgi:pimeloyl-ACP methyl ester carboxylesterase